MGWLSEIPGNPSSGFRIGELPGDRTLVAGVHTGSALNTIFYLESDIARFIQGITVGRADVSGAFVGTDGITDLCIDLDMRFDIRPGLISVTD
ncbi:MAG: hypothetical protein WD355_06360 [Balneolaceae bacterium]